jgi:hypothetical protein
LGIYLASTSVTSGLALAAFVIAVFSAVVGGLSYFNSAASTTKKAWLDRGLEAYGALIAWRALWERARIPTASGAAELLSRVIDARTASAYHEASLYGESELLGNAYHEAVEAAIAAYEPAIRAVLEADATASDVRAGDIQVNTEYAETARRMFLQVLKRNASYYRKLRDWHLKPDFGELPDWL